MRKLLLIAICAISLSCYSQDKNRFEESFKKANFEFWEQCNNSINEKLFNVSCDIIFSNENSDKITITIDQALQLYFNGYLNGSENALNKSGVDFDQLIKDLKVNKKALGSYVKFKQELNKTNSHED